MHGADEFVAGGVLDEGNRWRQHGLRTSAWTSEPAALWWRVEQDGLHPPGLGARSRRKTSEHCLHGIDQGDKVTEDIRSRRDLATMASRVATAVDADAIICATELGELARRLADADPTRRLIVASHNAQTLEDLQDDGIDVVAVTTLVEDRYRQARVVTASVLASRALDDGDLVVCVVGHRTSLGGGDLIMVTDLDETSQIKGVGDLVSLTDGVSPTVLESLLEVADRIDACPNGANASARCSSSETRTGSRRVRVNWSSTPCAGTTRNTARSRTPTCTTPWSNWRSSTARSSCAGTVSSLPVACS